MKLRANGIIFAVALLACTEGSVTRVDLIGQPVPVGTPKSEWPHYEAICQAKERIKRKELKDEPQACVKMNRSDFDFLLKNAGRVAWTDAC